MWYISMGYTSTSSQQEMRESYQPWLALMWTGFPYTVKKTCTKFRCGQRWREPNDVGVGKFLLPCSLVLRHRCPSEFGAFPTWLFYSVSVLCSGHPMDLNTPRFVFVVSSHWDLFFWDLESKFLLNLKIKCHWFSYNCRLIYWYNFPALLILIELFNFCYYVCFLVYSLNIVQC